MPTSRNGTADTNPEPWYIRHGDLIAEAVIVAFAIGLYHMLSFRVFVVFMLLMILLVSIDGGDS